MQMNGVRYRLMDGIVQAHDDNPLRVGHKGEIRGHSSEGQHDRVTGLTLDEGVMAGIWFARQGLDCLPATRPSPPTKVSV